MSLAEEASCGIICSKVVYSRIVQTMGTRGFFLACGGNLGTNRARTVSGTQGTLYTSCPPNNLALRFHTMSSYFEIFFSSALWSQKNNSKQSWEQYLVNTRYMKEFLTRGFKIITFHSKPIIQASLLHPVRDYLVNTPWWEEICKRKRAVVKQGSVELVKGEKLI